MHSLINQKFVLLKCDAAKELLMPNVLFLNFPIGILVLYNGRPEDTVPIIDMEKAFVYNIFTPN